jgi:hypothetical protein
VLLGGIRQCGVISKAKVGSWGANALAIWPGAQREMPCVECSEATGWLRVCLTGG